MEFINFSSKECNKFYRKESVFFWINCTCIGEEDLEQQEDFLWTCEKI